MTIKEALILVLDQVDYTQGRCSVADMVAAVLPKEVIDLAREALAADDVQSPSFELVVVDGETAIRCLRCGATSFNPNDLTERYCGQCHRFHEDRESS